MRFGDGTAAGCATRFYSKVDTSAGPDGCWPWTAGKRDGYGSFWLNGRDWPAHRIAYWLATGDDLDGALIDHRCRNKGCVHAAHLRPATHGENNQNLDARGWGQSGIRGVYQWGNRWKAELTVNHRRMYLGMFVTPELAAAAVSAKRRELMPFSEIDRLPQSAEATASP